MKISWNSRPNWFNGHVNKEQQSGRQEEQAAEWENKDAKPGTSCRAGEKRHNAGDSGYKDSEKRRKFVEQAAEQEKKDAKPEILRSFAIPPSVGEYFQGLSKPPLSSEEILPSFAIPPLVGEYFQGLSKPPLLSEEILRSFAIPPLVDECNVMTEILPSFVISPLVDECNVMTVLNSTIQAEQAAEQEKKDAKPAEQASDLVWRKFLLPHNTVKVTLDLHTVHRRLVLSEDHRSVRKKRIQQPVPNSPERFDCWCCVLGREEFREGWHCWLVEVEGKLTTNSWWAVGVARESVKRKRWFNISPEEGIWAVWYNKGHLRSLTWPHTPLFFSPVPTRIWVCLDWTHGQVSFINADNGAEIFTFTAASFNGESIRPWFWLETVGIQLCLRDSAPQTLSPALGGSCPSPDTPQTPLLGPAGAAQE